MNMRRMGLLWEDVWIAMGLFSRIYIYIYNIFGCEDF